MIDKFITDKTAELNIEGRSYSLPIIEGTEGEKAIDIRNLRQDTGYITLDKGYMNTGSCASEITYLDGAKGILIYRGYKWFCRLLCIGPAGKAYVLYARGVQSFDHANNTDFYLWKLRRIT